MENEKPPKKPKAPPRPTPTVRAPALVPRSIASDLNLSSQPQVPEASRAVGANMNSWTSNHSCDQSVHLVGPQVDDERAAERSRPGHYDKNWSFDQSFTITGPTSKKTLEMVTKTWLELAKHAVEKKKGDSRELHPSSVYRLVINKALRYRIPEWSLSFVQIQRLLDLVWYIWSVDEPD
jgi:hypothetical protein